jgi:MATE family multidrug resistance protein
MIGFGIAVTTLVGQALGKNDAQLAQRTCWSAFYMTFAYMFLIAVGYWFWPNLFLYPFSFGENPQEFYAVAPLAEQLLGFVAIYCLFDTGNIIFSAALKGAGDTRFVMVVSVVLSWILMTLPCYLAVNYQWGSHNGLYVAWGFTTSFVCVLAVVFLLRFLHGKWKTMRVIEAVPVVVPPKLPTVPTVETETT